MKAIINNSTCMIVSRERLTRGTVGKTMEAEFSADWEGLAITATFEAGDEKRDKVYTGEPIVIPHEVLTTAGVSVMLGFHGAMPDGTIVKRTAKEWINNVSETLDPAGVPSSEPTPDWTAQVQNIATEAKQVADSVRSDADAGKFNGQPGEAGGWYAPEVTQPDESTLRFAFTPSKEGMPEVPPKDIAIPGGGGSGVVTGTYDFSVLARGTFPANTITGVTLGNGLIDTGITLGMLRQYKIFNMAYRCDSANQYYCFAVGKANQTPARFVRFIYSTKNATNSTVFWIDNAKTSVIMLSGIGNANVTQPLAAENMGGFLPNGLTSTAAAMGSINAYGNLADYPDESKIYVGVMNMNGQTTNTKDLTWSICGVVR